MQLGIHGNLQPVHSMIMTALNCSDTSMAPPVGGGKTVGQRKSCGMILTVKAHQTVSPTRHVYTKEHSARQKAIFYMLCYHTVLGFLYNM